MYSIDNYEHKVQESYISNNIKFQVGHKYNYLKTILKAGKYQRRKRNTIRCFIMCFTSFLLFT